MTTRRTTLVGKPASTPTPAAPAGSEVTAPVASNPVQGPGTALGAAAPASRLVAALGVFSAALGPLEDALTPYLQTMTVTERKRRGRVSALRQAAMPALAQVLRDWPALAPDCQPETIEVSLVVSTSIQRVADVLQSLMNRVQDTGRLNLEAGWGQASEVYKVAQVRARKDADLQARLVPVQSALRRGPRPATTAQKADTTSRKALAARRRAAKSQQQAAAAHRTAAFVDGSLQPSTVNPQGPSASAEAAAQGPAVNPQGPASGR